MKYRYFNLLLLWAWPGLSLYVQPSINAPKEKTINILLDNSQKILKLSRKQAPVYQTKPKKGTFGYDVQFLKKHYDRSVVLTDENANVVVTPELQGVFGWVLKAGNFQYILNQKLLSNFKTGMFQRK